MIVKLKKKQKRLVKEIYRRVMSGVLAFVMLLTSYIPFPSYALTGGPSQPEVQGFTPIGTSDMVDLFSGDFKYNIPLLSVDGYPINIGYSGNIGMDQEASWVGLGWNLNVGTVNRAVRGIPDDFDGEEIHTTTRQEPSITTSVEMGLELELFGVKGSDAKHITPNASLSLGGSVGMTISNYTGIGLSIGLDISGGIGPLQGNLGLQSSSDNGLSIQPNVSLTNQIKNSGGPETSLSTSIGSSFNSRSGLQQLSINSSITQKGDKITKDGNKVKNAARSSVGGSASFDLMQPTFTPQISQSMISGSLSGKFKIGAAGMATHVGASVSASYSVQTILNPNLTNYAYGYLYSQNVSANKKSKAMLDFNRENDGTFSDKTPALPLTNHTYDIFSVSGQGTGGSYRPFRSEVGRVYDPTAKTISSGGSIGGELGGGAFFEAGVNVNANTVNAKSGDWTSDNFAQNTIKYRQNSPYQDYEPYYFKEANEMNVTSDPDFIDRFGGYQAISLNLDEVASFKTAATPHWKSNAQPSKHVIPYNYRDERERRNNVFQTLNRYELETGYGLDEAPDDPANKTKPAHIAEVTNLGSDGSRYVYGIAAYNNTKKEVSFSIANNIYDASGPFPYDPNYQTGLIQYEPGEDNSVDNSWGVDHYFNQVVTPAYAHSYLLTAIVSPDYVDMDGVKGPSKDDMGSWTKFHYTKSSDAYQWRVPYEEDRASFQEGMKTDDTDDKASYIYGTKELYYINKIETKNFVAIFEISNRDDALGVKGENGGANTSNNDLRMKKLDKITLYAKPDYEANGASATAIKTVHFEYDYSLCEEVPNNVNVIADNPSNRGKLTLKRVYFTYRDSKKGKLSPYSFEYGYNPDYNLRGYDRWGNYKENIATNPSSYPEFDAANDNATVELTNPEFPYVNQSNSSQQDSYAAAWAMTKVNLPSGGDITVSYESDDYMYVQDKKAMQMYKLIGAEDHNGNFTSADISVLGDDNKENRKIYFEMPQGADITEIVGGIENLYFKCLMEFPVGTTPMYEFVQGYCEIAGYGTYDNGGTTVGWIKPKPVKLADRNNESAIYSPIARAGIQFGRLYLSKYIFNEPALASSNAGFVASYIQDLVNLFDNFVEGFKNPNLALWDDGKGTKFVKNKSWIRLNHAEDGKLGGGNRVAQVQINDNWDLMTSEEESDYGQEYNYTTTDSQGNVISSGIASYEPQLGGEENPWKQPVSYEKENRLAPDERFYQSTPFGESFFPSASVGYSKVTVKNLERDFTTSSGKKVTRHATGKVVHTFYTAKDFPTKVGRTIVDDVHQKNNPFSINSLFKIDSKDYMTASQGFYVETNDMHGKPRSQNVYQEGKTEPITSVKYYYADDTDDDDIISNLDNRVKTIMPDGSVDEATVGVHFDIVTDFREYKTASLSAGAQINADGFPLLIVPIVVPTVWPSFKLDRTKFRSVSTTKVVQRFGVLEKTVATDLGSRVETENLAYDGITGQVLLTKTKTNFQDDVYTLQYPAYWYYDAMGPAYHNIGIEDQLKQFDANGTTSIANAEFRYTEGDELILDEGLLTPTTTKRGWVVDVSPGEITVMLKNGNPYTSFAKKIKVIRSGRRNQQMNPMASVTSRVNPLNTFSSNIYKNVIQASAIEFTDQWRSYCDCFLDDNDNAISTNPYVLGTKGNWRPKTSYLHLSGRTQSDFNNNTNIRDDGFFQSYTPFYALNSGSWEIDRDDWTYTAEVTEFNPFGQELENQDALGRYSAATFGFNQTLATAVAANTRYHELGFDGFEDYDFSNCADRHFEFSDFSANVTSTQAHTGYHSIKVSSGTDVKLNKALVEYCDDTDCDLDITYIYDDTDLRAYRVDFTPLNADGYVLAEWNELSNDGGTISYSPTSNTITFVYDSVDETAVIEIVFVDESGCRIEKTFSMSSSGVTEL